MIITLEGIDASGKATQTKRLVERYKSQGMDSERFDFPRYQSKVGQNILGLLKEEWFVTSPRMQEGFDGHPETVLAADPAKKALVLQALMTVNRYEYYGYLKEWADNPEGVLVLDRYFGSGIVYGECDGLERNFLMEIHQALPQPDVWVFVDITAEESVRRRPERRDEYERREGFMAKVRNTYLDLFNERGWAIVDGEGSEDEVHERIWKAVNND